MTTLEAVLRIGSTWRGRPLPDSEQATLHLARRDDGDLHVRIEAPFHGDPPPPGEPGSLDGLWNHEVVELFLVDASSPRDAPLYTEIECSPHGHHLVLRFEGVRQRIASELPLDYSAVIDGEVWRGEAILAARFLPPEPWLANAFAVHGSMAERHYAAASPLPGDEVDFHRPERFPRLVVLSGM